MNLHWAVWRITFMSKVKGTVMCLYLYSSWLIYFCLLQAVEKLVQAAESGCPSESEKQVVLNCTRILSRILPYIFEDQDWRGFFWSTVPGAGRAGVSNASHHSRLIHVKQHLQRLRWDPGRAGVLRSRVVLHAEHWFRLLFQSMRTKLAHVYQVSRVLLQDQLAPVHSVPCSNQKRETYNHSFKVVSSSSNPDLALTDEIIMNLKSTSCMHVNTNSVVCNSDDLWLILMCLL